MCKYFCQGVLPAEIPELLKQNHGIEMGRERPYRLIAEAAENGRLAYAAPPETVLAHDLNTEYDWLKGVRVAHTATFDDVAAHTAQVVLQLLQERARPSSASDEVHVGFAGGHAMRRVAQFLARDLWQPTQPVPKTIVLHALVAAFDGDDPTTDPNAFFTYFVNDWPINMKYVGLHAPLFVEVGDFDKLKKLDGIRQAFERRDELDILVSSAGSWRSPCDHSMLRKFMKESDKTIEVLEEHRCLGDLMWRPLNAEGPITAATERRAMTIIELTDLPGLIDAGKKVVLMLGPCRACREPRDELLRTILGFDPHLITHLVTDTRSAAAVLKPVRRPLTD